MKKKEVQKNTSVNLFKKKIETYYYLKVETLIKTYCFVFFYLYLRNTFFTINLFRSVKKSNFVFV